MVPTENKANAFRWSTIPQKQFIIIIIIIISIKVKHFLNVLYECLHITVVVTMCWASLCIEHFWVLLVQFVLFSSNIMEPSHISIWLFVCLSFWTPFYRGSDNITYVCLSVCLSFRASVWLFSQELVNSFFWFFAWW